MADKLVFAALALASLTITLAIFFQPNENTKPQRFKQFLDHKAKFGKGYSTIKEAAYRYKVYSANMETIERHNASPCSYKMAENKFTDMTFAEFKSKYLASEVHYPSTSTLAEKTLKVGHFDWKSKGMVSRVKDQGSCTSGYAFAAVGAMESAYAIFKRQRVDLSVQEIVDCSVQENGCMGGLMSFALNYVLDSGLSSTADYPYTGKRDKCSSNSSVQKYGMAGYKMVLPTDVTSIVDALNEQPVGVGFYATKDFMHYSSGIYQNDGCGAYINHMLLVVAYYTDVELPYFVIKNSWGTSWGDEGYAKVKIGEGAGTCGIVGTMNLIPFF